ncbi:MAG: biotin/lipoyl-binding carrier protein [Actinobacteria bacterium]|nr:biotin/lipoyl-binding carrier protein [Actinomycetota bacterium]
MSSPLESPVVGTVWKIEKEVGNAVSVGDVVMILESMKMEIPVEAEDAGVIEKIAVNEGDTVSEGDTLATIV